MANVKISDLPVASAISVNDKVIVEQSTGTKVTELQNITDMRKNAWSGVATFDGSIVHVTSVDGDYPMSGYSILYVYFSEAVSLISSGIPMDVDGGDYKYISTSPTTLMNPSKAISAGTIIPFMYVDPYYVIANYDDDSSTTIDTAMSDSSTNPVQNRVIKTYVDLRTVATNVDAMISAGNLNGYLFVYTTKTRPQLLLTVHETYLSDGWYQMTRLVEGVDYDVEVKSPTDPETVNSSQVTVTVTLKQAHSRTVYLSLSGDVRFRGM